MKKLFSYVCATLLVASSTNAMMTITQGINVQKAPPEYLNLTNTCSKGEEPLNQIEEAHNYIVDLFPNNIPTIEQIEQEMGLQKYPYLEKIERALNCLEKNIIQALRRPNNESKKVYEKVYKIISTIDELKEEKRKLESLTSFEPTNEYDNMLHKHEMSIGGFLYRTISNMQAESKNLKNSNSFFSLYSLRTRLADSARKEIQKYKVQKKLAKAYSKWKKEDFDVFRLFMFIKKPRFSDLKTVKLNAEWYETEGYKIDLKNPECSQNILDWVAHTKQCSEFLKQENIQ